MTTPDKIVVTQADREAAYAMFRHFNPDVQGAGNGALGGYCDDGEVVQAFARHRIEATPSVDRADDGGELFNRLNSFTTCGCCDDDWPQLRHDLADTILSLQAQLVSQEALVEALRQAAQWFESYAADHAAKALVSPSYAEQGAREDKAKRNKERAAFLRAALSKVNDRKDNT